MTNVILNIWCNWQVLDIEIRNQMVFSLRAFFTLSIISIFFGLLESRYNYPKRSYTYDKTSSLQYSHLTDRLENTPMTDYETPQTPQSNKDFNSIIENDDEDDEDDNDDDDDDGNSSFSSFACTSINTAFLNNIESV